jgi:hypothetical protein
MDTMKILYYLTISLSLLACVEGFAQEASIDYILPKEVEGVLKKYLDNERDTTRKYYCVIRNHENVITLSVQFYEIGSTSEFVKVIKSSNRFVSLDSARIPVIFNTDYLLVAYGRDAKGRPIRKQVIFEHPYKIEFDNVGKILSKGY